jgi:hypothetical protein
VLGTRWSKAPAGGTTSLSGLDDNSVSLVYSVGYEQVYRNGVLLSRGNDYTATSGTSITLTDATIAGDIVEVFAQELLPLTDAISKGQFTAKGSLLSASAASTPAVLAVGSNDQVLTADSSTTTGLKWATASSGGMTLLSTTTLSGTSTNISSISSAYNALYIVIYGITNASNTTYYIRPNDSASICTRGVARYYSSPEVAGVTGGSGDLYLTNNNITGSGGNNAVVLWIYDYASATNYKPLQEITITDGAGNSGEISFGGFTTNTAISSLKVYANAGSMTAGTVKIYGVK